MGIINATPDSFSGDGLLSTASPDEIAVRAAAQAAGFTPVRPVIEVRGICADCA